MVKKSFIYLYKTIIYFFFKIWLYFYRFCSSTLFSIFSIYKKRKTNNRFLYFNVCNLCWWSGKKVSKESFVAKLFYKIDRYVLKKAKYVICDTKAHRDYFIKEFKAAKEKFFVIYIIADTSIMILRNIIKDKK